MTDEQLLEKLREATRGLTYMSESDYPLEVFDWGETEPTPEFLRSLGGSDAGAPVETRTPADFFRSATTEPDWKSAEELATAKRFKALLRLLEGNLKDLKVYRVGSINIP